VDRETYLRRLGDDLEPGRRDPAPQPLRVIQQFVNTYNHELGDNRDRLRSLREAREWLIEHSLLEPARKLTANDLKRLRSLRETMRGLVGLSGDSESSALQDLSYDLGGGIRMNVAIASDGRVRLEPTGAVVERIAGSLLVIVHEAMVTESWSRMKLCRQCEWLFFDHSRNRSGSWCAMAVCGNRAKNRAYRKRTGG